MSTEVSEYRRQEQSVDVSAQMQPVEGFEEELLTINFGPVHPSTHGVINFLVQTDGEVMKRAIPEVGYLHRSLEKIGERWFTRFAGVAMVEAAERGVG